MSVPQRRIFDGKLLRATLFNPGGKGLFVSFRQRVVDPGSFAAPQPVRSFTDKGFAHLHLQSRCNDWFINPETTDLETALAGHATGRDPVRAMGFSMGGYGALRFARCLRLDLVALVSPQLSIHPEVVPWDGRFRDCAGGFDRTLGDLAARAVPGLRGVLAYDPFRAADRRNARAIAGIFPALELCALPGGGHPATQLLRLGGSYGQIQTRLREDRLRRRWIVREHRRLRVDSALYWDRLAEYAARRGRAALARTASGVARRLKADQEG
ncbi:alpha/beta hydrolase [Sedimentitalea sp. JM2-8]|uniref:Alpha/beta hydrolase n=1 Tax=Sedimentitalea xiamensis TaxID=3050037 RepID=A0ABT7FL11_9RHOB|nr:alpha/beta hydrolase [Sedimentitalea xiamensis]MDK3075856.1 alpha/beta hydrolase [Sedimentitalea xiamensis]